MPEGLEINVHVKEADNDQSSTWYLFIFREKLIYFGRRINYLWINWGLTNEESIEGRCESI